MSQIEQRQENTEKAGQRKREIKKNKRKSEDGPVKD